MKAIMVCVNYWDYLELTLPLNRHHFDEVMIVTSTTDKKTVEVGIKNKCSIYQTDSFYDDGASFNKWKALEEGLRFIRRPNSSNLNDRWLSIMDADVVWPRKLPDNFKPQKGNLYGPYRYLLPTFQNSYIPKEQDWPKYHMSRCQEFSGFTQIFHIDDPVLKNEEEWFQQDWMHAGGGDTYFQLRWPQERRVRTNWRVLHIGPHGRNWCGRSNDYLDGTEPEGSRESARKLQQFMQSRRETRAANNYESERIKK